MSRTETPRELLDVLRKVGKGSMQRVSNCSELAKPGGWRNDRSAASASNASNGASMNQLLAASGTQARTLMVGHVPHDPEGDEVPGTLAIRPDGLMHHGTMRESNRERPGGWGIVSPGRAP